MTRITLDVSVWLKYNELKVDKTFKKQSHWKIGVKEKLFFARREQAQILTQFVTFYEVLHEYNFYWFMSCDKKWFFIIKYSQIHGINN